MANHDADGDVLFQKGKDALAAPDVTAAKKYFREAAEAFARSGASKKQQLMEAMIQRIESAPGEAKSAKPAPPGPSKTSAPAAATPKPAAKAPAPAAPEVVKKKYSMDYSRFDQLADDSDDEENPSTQMGNFAGGPPRDLPKRMPPKFLEAMRFNEQVLQRGNKPEDLVKAERMFQEAFEECSPDARNEIWEMLNAGGADLPAELKGSFLGGDSDSLKTALKRSEGTGSEGADAEPISASDPEVIQKKLQTLKASMEGDLASLSSRMEEMRKQEEALVGAQNFEQLVDFMQKSGLTDEQIDAAMKAHEEGDEEVRICRA